MALSINTVAQSGQYTVQVDSMTAQEAAEGKVQTLRSQGQQAYWLKSNVPGQGLRYRVRVGRFPSRVAAQNFGSRLKQQGLTADYFVALYEGTSSSLSDPVKKPAPPPVLGVTPKTAPVETKTAEDKPAQRQREIKSVPTPIQSPPPANTTVEKPANTPPTNGNVTKPIVAPQPVMTPTIPSNTPAPKSVTPPATESKPLQSKPLNPTPLDEVKPPRDKKAENVVPNNSAAPTTNSPATTTAAIAAKPEVVLDKAATTSGPNIKVVGGEVTTPPADTFLRFEERTYGYSFEHPNYWNGGRLSPEELQTQRIDAGAVFRSQEDVAFMNAIWNSLKNANSPAYDNNLIVDLVIKSLSSGTGLQGLSEVSRRMVQEGDQIKTFVDLRTLFRQPRASSPLEFQGKAVIIRANTGILLVVSFYSKDSAPAMIAAAERIISSARVP